MDERLKEIRQAVTLALVEAGMKRGAYDNWQDFRLRIRDSYSEITVTVTPDYRAQKYGARHSTYRIGRNEDPAPKIARVVEKAKELVKAELDAQERDESARVGREARMAELRAAAAEHFPDFGSSYTGDNSLLIRRDADDCEVRLVNYGGGVSVDKVTFNRMTIEEARAIVGELSTAKATTP